MTWTDLAEMDALEAITEPLPKASSTRGLSKGIVVITLAFSAGFADLPPSMLGSPTSVRASLSRASPGVTPLDSEGATTSARSNPSIDAWLTYVSRLDEVGLDLEHARYMRAFVKDLWKRFPDLVPPHAGPTEDGSFEMVWDHGKNFVLVRLQADGTFDWFYRQRGSEKLDAEDACTTARFPHRLKKALAHFS